MYELVRIGGSVVRLLMGSHVGRKAEFVDLLVNTVPRHVRPGQHPTADSVGLDSGHVFIVVKANWLCESRCCPV